MSGISGIWNTDGRPLERTKLEAVSSQLSHRGLDGEFSWIDGPLGLSCQLMRNAPESAFEAQPYAHQNCVVVFDGRLDDRDELIPNLAESTFGETTPSPNLIIAAYQKWGDDFVSHLNGDFALALFDITQQKLVLARDAIGPRPLYYFQTASSVVFASEIKALLAHPLAPREPSREGLAEYLIGAQGPFTRTTLFKDIHRVIPAHTTVCTRESVTTRKYWDFNPESRLRLKSFGEYAEALSFQFQRAVKRRIRSSFPVGVFVSGGLDSSAIFCLSETLRRNKATPCPAVYGACQYGPAGTLADEISFIEYIERDYGIPIDRIERTKIRSIDTGLEKIRRTEVPEPDLFARANDGLAISLRNKGVRTLMAGHWGDHLLSSQTYLVELAYNFRWLSVYKHLREYPRWLTEAEPTAFVRLFRTELLRDLVLAHWPESLVSSLGRLRSKAVLRARGSDWYTKTFRDEAKRSGAAHALVARNFHTPSSRSYYGLVRGSFLVAGQEYDSMWLSPFGMDSVSPFIDRELIAFGLAIPAEMQVWKGVPKALFRQAMNGILPPEIQYRRSKGDVTELMEDSVTACFGEIADHLAKPTAAEEIGLIEGEFVRRELEECQATPNVDPDVARRALSLVGLDHWIKTFFPTRSRTARDQ